MKKEIKNQERRWVLKIGNSLTTNSKRDFDQLSLARWVAEIGELQQYGLEIVLVSSGAITEGISRLGWNQRPHDTTRLQAAAAVGQIALMNAYEIAFHQKDLCSAQFLLTREDFSSQQRYLNLQAAIHKLMKLRTISVISENRATSTEKTQMDGCDMLAASIAKMIGADRLVILTNKKISYTDDLRRASRVEIFGDSPQENSRLKGFEKVIRNDQISMSNKIKAAEVFSLYGGAATIASGRIDRVLQKIRLGVLKNPIFFQGEELNIN